MKKIVRQIPGQRRGSGDAVEAVMNGMAKPAPEAPAPGATLAPTPEAPAPKAPEAAPAPTQPKAPEAAPAPTQPKAPEAPADDLSGQVDTSKTVDEPEETPKKVKMPKWNDLLHELMVSNMLFQIPTHMFNMQENAFRTLTAPLETATRALISVGRRPEDRTYLREAFAEAGGLANGFAAALKYSGYRFKSKLPGVVETQDETLARLKISPSIASGSKAGMERNWTSEKVLGPDARGIAAKGIDLMGSYLAIPGSALDTVDMLTKIVHHNGKAYADASRMVAQGSKKSFKEAHEAILNDPNWAKKSAEHTKYWALQGDPESSVKWILSDSADKVPGLRWIVPFRRAVANLYEQTAERSPLIMMHPVLLKKMTDPDPVVRDTARARLLFGMTSITMMAYTLEDKLSGAPPTYDRSQVEIFRNANGLEDMLWVTPDQGVDLRVLGPYGTYLKTIAAYRDWNANMRGSKIHSNEQREGNDQFYKEMGQFVVPVFKAFSDNHWGASITEFMSVVTDSIDRQDGKPLATWLTRNLSRTIPLVGAGFTRNIAKHMDPMIKDSSGPLDLLLASMPRLREHVGNSWSWDGDYMYEKHMYKGANPQYSMTGPKGKPSRLDVLLADLQVKFIKASDSVSSKSIDGGANPSRAMTDQEWQAFNAARFTGYGGLPPIREILERHVKTDTFKRQNKFPRVQAKQLQTEFSAYVTQLKAMMVPLQKRGAEQTMQNVQEFNQLNKEMRAN